METPNPESKPEEKIEYNENTAILKKDLMIGLLRTEHGPAVLVNLHGREEIIMAKGEIEQFLTMKLMQGDMQAQSMRSKIVPAKGGFISGLRNRIK